MQLMLPYQPEITKSKNDLLLLANAPHFQKKNNNFQVAWNMLLQMNANVS